MKENPELKAIMAAEAVENLAHHRMVMAALDKHLKAEKALKMKAFV